MRYLFAPCIVLGLIASPGFVAHAAPLASPKPATLAPGCAQTLAIEKAAAGEGVTPRAMLDAANDGLIANRRCGDPVMHPVNEAFLLSLRAMAKVALHEADWRTDFARANALLAECRARHDKAAAPATGVCKTQQDFNDRFIADYAPAPAPGASGGAKSIPAPLVAPINPPGMTPAPEPTTSPATIGPVPPAPGH